MTRMGTAQLDGRIDTPQRRPERPWLVVLLAAVYLLMLVWTVLWKLHAPFAGTDTLRAVKLVPFAPSGEFGVSAPFEVGMNLLVFIPFGIYAALLVLSARAWSIAVAGAGLSLGLEFGQYVLATGSSDATDVIVNSAGALIGWCVFGLARRTLGARTTAVVARFCMVGTVLGVLAVGSYVASLPRLSPPQEGATVSSIVAP